MTSFEQKKPLAIKLPLYCCGAESSSQNASVQYYQPIALNSTARRIESTSRKTSEMTSPRAAVCERCLELEKVLKTQQSMMTLRCQQIETLKVEVQKLRSPGLSQAEAFLRCKNSHYEQQIGKLIQEINVINEQRMGLLTSRGTIQQLTDQNKTAIEVLKQENGFLQNQVLKWQEAYKCVLAEKSELEESYRQEVTSIMNSHLEIINKVKERDSKSSFRDEIEKKMVLEDKDLNTVIEKASKQSEANSQKLKDDTLRLLEEYRVKYKKAKEQIKRLRTDKDCKSYLISNQQRGQFEHKRACRSETISYNAEVESKEEITAAINMLTPKLHSRQY